VGRHFARRRILYIFHEKTGHQYICEASSLLPIADNSYDFVLSCHSLEHVANVLQTLHEWKRVLKPGGALLLVLPDKRYTFDHRRPYTSFEHLLQDFKNNIDEHDTFAFAEIMELHDMQMDKGVNTKEALQIRTQNNFINRCVHHHVFSLPLLKQVLEYSGFSVLHGQEVSNFHLVMYAVKQ